MVPLDSCSVQRPAARSRSWTERATDGSTVRVNGDAPVMFDGVGRRNAVLWSRDGSGMVEVLAVDFGNHPQIRQFDTNWKLVPTQGFANPFATGDPVDAADPDKMHNANPATLFPSTSHSWVETSSSATQYRALKNQNGKTNPNEFEAGEEDASTQGRQELGCTS